MPRAVGQISRHFQARVVAGAMREANPLNNARLISSQPRARSGRDRGEDGGSGGWWRSGNSSAAWALAAGAAVAAGEVVRQQVQCESGSALKVKNVLPLGTVADRFRIESTLGEGGQAVVYKAYDKKAKKMVRSRMIATCYFCMSQKASAPLQFAL